VVPVAVYGVVPLLLRLLTEKSRCGRSVRTTAAAVQEDHA
jgi:hypothetical protein